MIRAVVTKSGEWMMICVVLGDGWWKTPVVELPQSHTDSRHADALRVAKRPELRAIVARTHTQAPNVSAGP